MKYVLPYSWQYDEDGNKTQIWVFSALDTSCTMMDINNAFSDGYISEQYKNALLGNMYGGDTPPQPENWVAIV